MKYFNFPNLIPNNSEPRPPKTGLKKTEHI